MPAPRGFDAWGFQYRLGGLGTLGSPSLSHASSYFG